MNTTNIGKTDVKIPVIKKIGYGFGGFGSTLAWTLVSSYLTVYYSDVVGMAPAIISIVMLIARIWQAGCDLAFGAIAENTHSRFGRYRPYILFGAPLLALFTCLTFIDLDIPNQLKVVWCTVTYLLSATAYSFANGAVSCVVNSMTSINEERVSCNAVKGIVGGIGGIIINAVTMPLILKFGNGNAASAKGYFLTALIFSICSILCFFFCFMSIKEVLGGGRSAKAPKQKVIVVVLSSFAKAFKDRNVAWLVIAMMVYLTGILGRVGIMVYYFIYIVQDPMGMAAFGTAMTAGMFVVNLYAPFLLNRMDKKYVCVLSCILQIICCVAFFFMGEVGTPSMIIAVVGFFYGATNPVTLAAASLVGELIDDNWLRTGERSDGVIMSAISFSSKIANAIGGAIGIVLLGAVGFVPNSEMGAATLTKMDAVINFGPVIMYALAIIPFMMINMTNKKSRDNERLIKGKFSK